MEGQGSIKLNGQGVGKAVGQRIYVHADWAADVDDGLLKSLLLAERLACVNRSIHYNVIRYEPAASRLALLHYPGFFDEPFPALRESWLVDLSKEDWSHRTYEGSLNPPIMHRKELLIPGDHPRWAEYAALTEAAQSIGLFDDTTRIGYQRQWLQMVREKGYCIVGHELVPLGNDESQEGGYVPHHDSWSAARQLTALTRNGFSAPIQTLARYGFLDGRYTVLDYGCGRGDDVRGLLENGLQAMGWDPYFAPNNATTTADIVNLGFVVNVIEDFDERIDALAKAYSLARNLLVVSVMLINDSNTQGRQFRDGVLTKRGTFQKYFTQMEIKAFLEAVLDEEAIPVAPGVLYVFRNKDAEQQFLLNRYRSQRNSLEKPSRAACQVGIRERRSRADDKYAAYRESLDRLWALWVSLGRQPNKSEVENLVTFTEGFGSLGRTLRFIEARKGPEELVRARERRVADLGVYFALNKFARRKPYKHLEPGLRRDIKEFFGDYANANIAARELLYGIADIEAIERACRVAAERGLGWLKEGESLQLHTSMVEQLPPLLRVYVGCAAILYGDYRNADLVKVHIASGKVSIMKFDDFDGQPLPRMIERVKIKLREQDIEYYAYGEVYEPPFLYRKSRYINEEFPNFPEQVAFDEALEALDLFDFDDYGPKPTDLLETLSNNRWTADGFRLVRSQAIPNPENACGRYLTYRQLIECGEAQAQTGLSNRPKQAQSYNAIHDLVAMIIDPVIDYFGMIRLTYGFCSPELSKKIPGRIDPKRDQHAAHELNRRGKPICERFGAAVDFVVDDESMLEVAQWIVVNTPFDRLYFYGDRRPIHVSLGPENKREIVVMTSLANEKLVPRVLRKERFLSMV